MEHFTPFESSLGGALIGLASIFLLLLQGRVAGISGIAGGALVRSPGDTAWRWAFLTGLVISGTVMAALKPEWFDTSGTVALPAVALAGMLVGYGTRLGNGCTSGHGVCGISRFSQRSIVATMAFMASAGITVFFTH